jgi:hypothetical protein
MAAVEHLLEQRAVALATVLLTRHPAVDVTPAGRSAGYDLDIRLANGGTSSGRMFGVELKARLSLPRLGRFVDGDRLRLSRDLRQGLEGQQARVADLPFPLLFIVFAMDVDRGFYGWLREPTLRGGERRVLSPEVELALEWGPTTHVDIVDLVNRWYDAIPAQTRRAG